MCTAQSNMNLSRGRVDFTMASIDIISKVFFRPPRRHRRKLNVVDLDLNIEISNLDQVRYKFYSVMLEKDISMS